MEYLVCKNPLGFLKTEKKRKKPKTKNKRKIKRKTRKKRKSKTKKRKKSVGQGGYCRPVTSLSHARGMVALFPLTCQLRQCRAWYHRRVRKRGRAKQPL